MPSSNLRLKLEGIFFFARNFCLQVKGFIFSFAQI